MKIKYSLLVVVGILAMLSRPVMAQTNVANLTTLTNAVVKYPWNSSVDAGLTLTRGNSDTELFTLKLLTDRKTPINEYSFDADGAYGENNSVKNAETLHGFGQWNHLFSEKFFGYLRVEGLHDGIADVKYRLTIGPGAGYYLIKTPQTTLATEVGGSYVRQELDGENSSYETLRVAERFEHKFKDYGARVWQNVEILPQFDKLNNYLVNAEIGIEAAVAKNLSLQAYVDDNFDNIPAPGRKKNDVKLVSGISYKF